MFAQLRAAAERTVEAPEARIADLLGLFSPIECRNDPRPAATGAVL